MTNRVLGLVVVAACGGGGESPDGDGGVGNCGAEGNGSVTGTVGGATIGPIVRANQVAVPGFGFAIVLDEVAGACGTPADTGEHLVLLFCTAPAAGSLTVVSEQQFMCPGSNAGS